MAYLFLILAGVASTAATLLLRRAGLSTDQSTLFGLPQALGLKGLAVLVYGLGFLAYAQALKQAPVSFAYPFMTGVTLLLTLSAGMFWLGESVNLRIALGVVFLVLGIILIGGR